MPLPLSLKKSDAGRILEFSKGLAILLIILHHYSRTIWYSRGLPLPALQQWNFDPAGQGYGLVAAFAQAGRFSDLCMQLTAQFGYVGVHLFVLMSGMGLALGTPATAAFGPFMKQRLRKIVPPFWTAVAFFAVMASAVGHPYTLQFTFERLFLLTTFDHENFFGFDTPLWCLAVFIQLYLVFLPLRWLINRYGPRILLLLAAISFVARWTMSAPPVLHWNPFFGHVFGLNWLAVFGIGVWIGCKLRKEGEISLPVWAVTGTTLAAMFLLVLSDSFQAVYPIHDTAIGVLTGVTALLSWRILSGVRLAAPLAVVGSVSFPLYLYHRPIVSLIVYSWYRGFIVPSLHPLVLGLATVLALIAIALLMRQVLRLRPNISNMAFGDRWVGVANHLAVPAYARADEEADRRTRFAPAFRPQTEDSEIQIAA